MMAHWAEEIQCLCYNLKGKSLPKKTDSKKLQAEILSSKIITLDVVTISQTTELLLTGCVPHIVYNGSSVCVERQRVHLYSQGGWVRKVNYIKKLN